MSSKDKLIKKLKSRPKDFTWDELTRLFGVLNFEETLKGKTGGSRRKFYHSKLELIVNLHKPHPSNIVKAYAIRQVIQKLKDARLL